MNPAAGAAHHAVDHLMALVIFAWSAITLW